MEFLLGTLACIGFAGWTAALVFMFRYELARFKSVEDFMRAVSASRVDDARALEIQQRVGKHIDNTVSDAVQRYERLVKPKDPPKPSTSGPMDTARSAPDLISAAIAYANAGGVLDTEPPSAEEA